MIIIPARFTAALDGDDMIVVIDNGTGDHKSVTNDIERVVRVVGEYVTIGKRQMIYRDSTGLWDGVAIRKGAFFGFVPLRTTDQRAAMVAARELIAIGQWGNKGI